MMEEKNLDEKKLTKIPDYDDRNSNNEYEAIIQGNEADGSANSTELILNNQQSSEKFKQDENQEQIKLENPLEKMPVNQQQQLEETKYMQIKTLTVQERLNEGSKQKELGNQLVQQKKYIEALQYYETAITIANPIYFLENTAEEDVKEMIKLNNNSLNNIGFCQLQLKEYENAIMNLNQILVSDPNNIKANYRLALCYKKCQNYEMALKHIIQTQAFVEQQKQLVWNDLTRESEEIKLLYEKQINSEKAQEIQQIKPDKQIIDNKQLSSFENNKLNYLLIAIPTFLTSTIFTKYLFKLQIKKCEGCSLYLALINRKPSFKMLFGIVSSGIIGICLMRRFFSIKYNLNQ